MISSTFSFTKNLKLNPGKEFCLLQSVILQKIAEERSLWGYSWGSIATRHINTILKILLSLNTKKKSTIMPYLRKNQFYLFLKFLQKC